MRLSIRHGHVGVAIRSFSFLALLFLFISNAHSTILLDNLPNINANTVIDETRPAELGILSQIIVGGSNVQIGGFSVWGDQTTGGNIKFAIFEQVGFNRIYASAAIAQAVAFDQWFDSPDLNLILNANTTYYFGLISDQEFTYHWSVDAPALTQNGLTSGQGGVAGANGNFQNFADPTMIDDDFFVQNALRIRSVPEPATLALMGLGMAGIGWRKKTSSS